MSFNISVFKKPAEEVYRQCWGDIQELDEDDFNKAKNAAIADLSSLLYRTTLLDIETFKNEVKNLNNTK
ncbi:hypothetical protein [Photorhabdus viridis]|uniref:hypothetical protein n=1 Tax=Photorhabdus viridis TaxID=3163327 RepID=UPI0033072736